MIHTLKSPALWIATWFGSGLAKKAPGTWGSLAALPFGIFFLYFGSPIILALAIIILFPLGLWATKQVLKGSGEDHDPKMVVVDEVIGQWIALLPALLFNPFHIVLAFVLFRGFDILKPWPVSFFDQKVPGAWGVIMDDIAAGVMAAIILIGLRYVGIV